MGNLNQNSVQELSAAELLNTEGGFMAEILLAAGLALLITEWESTKKAKKDLWNFEFDPPK